MQIDLLNLLGAGVQISPTAPTLGIAGEFDLVLAQTQFGGTSPPGVAPPPFLFGAVSATGTEEVSQIQPNAVASKLDFLPTDAEVKTSESAKATSPSLDSLLAAMNLSFRSLEPIVVVSPSIVSGPQARLTTLPLKPNELINLEAPATQSGHSESFFKPNVLETASMPTASPSVLIEGLSRQFSAKQGLDPEMLGDLGLHSMKATSTRPNFGTLEPITLASFQAITQANFSAKAILVAPVPQDAAVLDETTVDPIAQLSGPPIKSDQLGSNGPASLLTSAHSSTVQTSIEESELTQPISEFTNTAPAPMREPLTAAIRTEEVPKTAQLPERTQREVVQQTVDRIEAMAIQRPMSQVVIHLNPEHLGEIAIKVRMMGNRSEAEITATDERVVQALDGNRPQLVQAIESKGFSLSSLTMQFGGERGDQTPAQREDFARAMNSFQNASTDRGETATVPTYGSPQTGGLNLVI